MRILIDSQSDLIAVADTVHDWFFDLDEFLTQRGAERVFALVANTRKPSKTCTITVRNVKQVEVVDTSRVGWYDINNFEFVAPYIIVNTGIPLDMRIEVTKLEIEIDTRWWLS